MTERVKDPGLLPLRTILRRLLPMGLAMMIMLALIVGAWDVEEWSGVPLGRILAFVVILFVSGLLAAALMEWENRRERRRWSVQVSGDLVRIADEKGKTTEVPTSSLEAVVAIENPSIWRGDMDIALFDESDEPLILFPLVARGGSRFVEWLSSRQGFQFEEFAAAQRIAPSEGQVTWMAD